MCRVPPLFLCVEVCLCCAECFVLRDVLFFVLWCVLCFDVSIVSSIVLFSCVMFVLCVLFYVVLSVVFVVVVFCDALCVLCVFV